MRALVVYESMFGNTRAVAEGIGEGLGDRFEVTVVPVHAATGAMVNAADVLIVGGPTHVHGMSRLRSRKMAKTLSEKPGSGLAIEPNAVEFGLREWFDTFTGRPHGVAAAFDTRAHGKAIFTGRASKAIGHHLERLGFHLVGKKSFLVNGEGRLDEGEVERARVWGASLATVASVSPAGRAAA